MNKTEKTVEDNDRLLLITEVAEKLRVSRRTVDNLKNRGDIIFVKIGNQVRFRESDVQAFIEGAKV